MGERIGRSTVTFHYDFQRWETNDNLGIRMWMEFRIEGNIVMIHYIFLGIVDLSVLIPPPKNSRFSKQKWSLVDQGEGCIK